MLNTALNIGILIALAVVFVSFIAMIFRWKTDKRRVHVNHLLLATGAILCFGGIQQAVIRLVLAPAAHEQIAEMNAAREAEFAETSIVRVGDLFPDFSLRTVGGGDFSMLEAKGDVILINFFATWCGPCQNELPHIDRIWAEHRGNANFRLIVIGRDESLESVREYRDKNRFSFPIAADPDRKVYSLVADKLIPRTLLISRDGSVVYSKAGFCEDDLIQLKAVIEEQLAVL